MPNGITMLSDIRYTLRSLLKNPGFLTIAVLTLALGIGATTAIFSVVNAVLLRPLPYTQPERLARIYLESPTRQVFRFAANVPEYLDLQRDTTAWESLEGWLNLGVNLTTSTEPTRINTSLVTGGMFRTLGLIAALGRGIEPDDGKPGAAPVIVLSHGLWQRAFAGNESVVGRKVLLNGRTHTVIGVMPANLRVALGDGEIAEAWSPLQIDPANPGDRNSHMLALLGRLKPNVTLQQAQSEIDALVKHVGETGSGHRFQPGDHTVTAYSLQDEVVRTVRPTLRVLMGAVCFLLLIACVNVANLLLARAEARQREIAIRGALGAGMGAWLANLQPKACYCLYWAQRRVC